MDNPLSSSFNFKIPSGNDFVRLCIDKYNSLPKSGKPKPNEWTVLSCVILYNNETNKSKVIALGTGTKCIGKDQLCPLGQILNDSHAEILARRAFIRYIQNQILSKNDDGIFHYDTIRKCFNLKKNFSFHFFSTHPPCGDASIIESPINSESPAAKRIKIDEQKNIGSEIFTGAKLIDSRKELDLMDQKVGPVRIKPGKGTPTLSMSCSDKIARWNVLGLQGALLDLILGEPIYLNSYTFCSKNSHLKSICRAIYERWFQKPFTDNNRFHVHQPNIRNCLTVLCPTEFIPTDDKEPCPSGIMWCDVKEKPLEVTISGKRQGVTKKNWNKLSSSLNISKVILFKEFKQILKSKSEILEKFSLCEEDLEFSNYENIKDLSEEYQKTWKILKTEYIGIWTTKPENLKKFV